MSSFLWQDGEIIARLDDLDRAVLSAVPGLVASVGELGIDPAAGRLEAAVHRDDPELSAEFLRLAGDIIDEGRQADLAAFVAGYERASQGGSLTPGEAESWARALTTARLILGARLGIEEDGWEEDPTTDRFDPRIAALYVLGRLQESLMAALSKQFEEPVAERPSSDCHD